MTPAPEGGLHRPALNLVLNCLSAMLDSADFLKNSHFVVLHYTPCNFAYFLASSKCSLVPFPSLAVPVTQLLLI